MKIIFSSVYFVNKIFTRARNSSLVGIKKNPGFLNNECFGKLTAFR
jgi:hypothetical protein